MYEGGRGGGDIATVATGTSTTIAGVALLPNTGGKSLLTYLAVFAIVGGMIVVAAHIGVAVYRRKG